jgi:hypothetical protein
MTNQVNLENSVGNTKRLFEDDWRLDKMRMALGLEDPVDAYERTLIDADPMVRRLVAQFARIPTERQLERMLLDSSESVRAEFIRRSQRSLSPEQIQRVLDEEHHYEPIWALMGRKDIVFSRKQLSQMEQHVSPEVRLMFDRMREDLVNKAEHQELQVRYGCGEKRHAKKTL